MNTHRQAIAISALFFVAGCSSGPSSSNVATLYRNSSMGAARIHFASFDANESDPMFNLNNCQMSARLLNSNVAAHAEAAGEEPDGLVGFWCETGRYREKGTIPASFDAAYPTDV